MCASCLGRIPLKSFRFQRDLLLIDSFTGLETFCDSLLASYRIRTAISVVNSPTIALPQKHSICPAVGNLRFCSSRGLLRKSRRKKGEACHSYCSWIGQLCASREALTFPP